MERCSTRCLCWSTTPTPCVFDTEESSNMPVPIFAPTGSTCDGWIMDVSLFIYNYFTQNFGTSCHDLLVCLIPHVMLMLVRVGWCWLMELLRLGLYRKFKKRGSPTIHVRWQITFTPGKPLGRGLQRSFRLTWGALRTCHLSVRLW